MKLIPLYITNLLITIFSLNLKAQDSVILVYVSGEVNFTTEYITISSNSEEKGTIGINEYLIIDVGRGENINLDFYRRGLNSKSVAAFINEKITIFNVNLIDNISTIKKIDTNYASADLISICNKHLTTSVQNKLINCEIISESGILPDFGSSVSFLRPIINGGRLDSEVETVTLILKSHLSEKYKLINREDLDYLIEEQKLTISGLVNESSNNVEVGLIQSAEYLIKSEFTQINNSLYCSLSFINVNTSETNHAIVLIINNVLEFKDCISTIY